MSVERPQQSLDANEDITRRGALQFLGKAAATMAAVGSGIATASDTSAAERLQSYEEKVANIIRDIARTFGKEGRDARICETGEGLTRERVSSYLNWLSAASAGLERAYDRPRNRSPLERFMLRTDVPGLSTRSMSEVRKRELMSMAPRGTPPPLVGSNRYAVQKGNRKFEVTARHCAGANEGFFSIQRGPDVAVRELSSVPSNSIIDFEHPDVDADLAGNVGVIVGTTIRGESQRVHTPFVRATVPLLRILFPGFDTLARRDDYAEALKHTFICVLPPQWGLATEYGTQGLIGMSGSFTAVLNGRGEPVPSGPVMAVRNVEHSCTDFAGMCSTVGFVSTRKAVLHTIDAYERQKVAARNSR